MDHLIYIELFGISFIGAPQWYRLVKEVYQDIQLQRKRRYRSRQSRNHNPFL